MHRSTRLRSALVAATAVGALTLSACGSGGSGGGDDSVGVSLITKTASNPFFVTMADGAKEAAAENGVDLTTAAGKEDGDETSQIQAVEDAIARGDKGILITLNGPGVLPSLEKARDAGLTVIALDTPPDPTDAVDVTYATDNFKAGQLIGQWTAKKLDGQPATIALLDLFDDRVVSVDYDRDQGFLEGMGIDTKDPMKNGDEAKTGSYSGGDYTIVCNEPTLGSPDGGRTAMENCLGRNPDVNVVYTINEPAAIGADQALQAAGKKGQVTVVSIDGSCDGIAAVKDGTIGATSMQFPLKMAQDGVKTIADIAKGGDVPEMPEDGFVDTGTDLITDQPADGVKSEDTAAGADTCWG